MLSQSLWIEAPGQAVLRTSPLAAPGEGEVLVQTLHTGISRGTESLVFRGTVPPQLAARMRCPFQEGDFPGPLKYGYINVGRIIGGAGPVGQAVFCLYPHQDRFVVPADAVTPIPDGIPLGRAVLTANLETAINGVWDARPGPGDAIAVVGGGVVGCLVGWLCAQIPGCSVELIDTNPERAEIAQSLGMTFRLPHQARPEADRLFHASGSPAGLQTALNLAGEEAEIIELSWYGMTPVSVPLGAHFHPRRLTIRSSQVGNLPPHQRPRWTYRRRLALALRLLADPRLDGLINEHSAFSQLPQTLKRLTEAPSGVLCHRVDYPEPV